jgi:membrane protein implicated in regulation of membrane protease activity
MEVERMSDTVDQIVRDCARYWTQTDVPRHAVDEMRFELESHLREAEAEGRDPREVVGPNLAEFAEEWASEARRPGSRAFPSWDDVTRGGRHAETRSIARISAVLYGTAFAAIVIAVVLTSGEGGNVEDNELWRWVWTGLALLMGIGEIFTAGFFLLPFAVGGVAAAVLAWLGVHLLVQWIAFLGISIASLVYLQRFIRRQDALEQPRVGANRYVGARAIVLDDIDPVINVGRVRVETEEWRATTDGELIPSGTTVTVTGVRGARLVVAELP